jgi:hypothetical protein
VRGRFFSLEFSVGVGVEINGKIGVTQTKENGWLSAEMAPSMSLRLVLSTYLQSLGPWLRSLGTAAAGFHKSALFDESRIVMKGSSQ